jgi:hypothetical protein
LNGWKQISIALTIRRYRSFALSLVSAYPDINLVEAPTLDQMVTVREEGSAGHFLGGSVA